MKKIVLSILCVLSFYSAMGQAVVGTWQTKEISASKDVCIRQIFDFKPDSLLTVRYLLTNKPTGIVFSVETHGTYFVEGDLLNITLITTDNPKLLTEDKLSTNPSILEKTLAIENRLYWAVKYNMMTIPTQQTIAQVDAEHLVTSDLELTHFVDEAELARIAAEKEAARIAAAEREAARLQEAHRTIRQNSSIILSSASAKYLKSKYKAYDKSLGEVIPKERIDAVLELQNRVLSVIQSTYSQEYDDAAKKSGLGIEDLFATDGEGRLKIESLLNDTKQFESAHTDINELAQNNSSEISQTQPQKNNDPRPVEPGIAGRQVEQNENVKEHTSAVPGIYRKGRNLYLSGSDTLVTINDLYDSSSWESYRKGASLMKSGIYCYVASGLSAALIGTTIVYTDYFDTSNSVLMEFKESNLAVATLIAVPVCAVAGITLRVVGKNMINRVANKQNGTLISFISIGATPNGIGLAYNF